MNTDPVSVATAKVADDGVETQILYRIKANNAMKKRKQHTSNIFILWMGFPRTQICIKCISKHHVHVVLA